MIDQTKPHIVVHLASQLCAHCGAEHRWSCVYEAELKGRTNNLHPIRSLTAGLPILTVRLPMQHVPACHNCVEPLAAQALASAEAARLWSEAMRKHRPIDPTPAPVSATGRKIISAEDLA